MYASGCSTRCDCPLPVRGVSLTWRLELQGCKRHREVSPTGGLAQTVVCEASWKRLMGLRGLEVILYEVPSEKLAPTAFPNTCFQSPAAHNLPFTQVRQ